MLTASSPPFKDSAGKNHTASDKKQKSFQPVNASLL